MKRVSKKEHEEFIKNYPRRLSIDVSGIPDPPYRSWNDFTLGNWPDSVVAGECLFNGDPRCPNEPNHYFIKK